MSSGAVRLRAPGQSAASYQQQQTGSDAGQLSSFRREASHSYQSPIKPILSSDDLIPNQPKPAAHPGHRRGVSHGSALKPSADPPAAINAGNAGGSTNRPPLNVSHTTADSPAAPSPSSNSLQQASLLLAAHSLRIKASSAMRPSVYAMQPMNAITESSEWSSKIMPASAGSFDKTLGNDLTDEEAYSILKELSASEAHLRSFTDAELQELCAIFTILKIEAGETVMKVGESASFFALLLQGSCVATVNASIGSLPLPRGSWLGEMSYFEHGVRSADVTAAQDSILAIMTYKELDSLVTSFPSIYTKLLKLLAVVSIRKLHERIEAVITSNKPGNAPSSDNLMRSPSSHHGRKLSGEHAVSTLALPFGTQAHSSARSHGLGPQRSFTMSSTPSSDTPSSPRVGAAFSKAMASTDSPPAQPETLLRKRLATTLQIRHDIIWRDSPTADFESAEDSVQKAEGGGRSAKSSTDNLKDLAKKDTSNKLLQLYPNIDHLKSLTHKQKQELWDVYHVNRSSKGLQPDELRALSRDVIELILRNYVLWLKQNLQSKKKPVNEADLQVIVDKEKEYLLPGKKGQSDLQAVNAMGRHLTSQMTVSKNKPTSINKGTIPTLTEEVFCRSFDTALAESLHIKTKDPGLGCSIQ